MSTSIATVRTELLNPIGNWLDVPGRSNHFRGRWKIINRRNFSVNRIVATGSSIMTPCVAAESSQGLQRLPFKPERYNYWTWRGYIMHYVEQGEGFPVVLIHGFASSSFHWRYNLPELAKRYKVYALDLLGFGWSEKAKIDYDALIWRDQVVDFLKEVVKQPTVLVGNSLGGFTALLAAAPQPETNL
ncbi:2-hydroxymuconate semialdehyde hydrolase-like [Capsicum galapagoense]